MTMQILPHFKGIIILSQNYVLHIVFYIKPYYITICYI